jgi:hypothetical protein
MCARTEGNIRCSRSVRRNQSSDTAGDPPTSSDGATHCNPHTPAMPQCSSRTAHTHTRAHTHTLTRSHAQTHISARTHAPLVLQNVDTDAAHCVHVGVVDGGRKANLGGLHGVLSRQEHFQREPEACGEGARGMVHGKWNMQREKDAYLDGIGL